MANHEAYADMLIVAKLADAIDNIRTMTPANPYQQHKIIRKTELRIDEINQLLSEYEFSHKFVKLFETMKKELIDQIDIRRDNLARLVDTRYLPNKQFLDDEYTRLKDKYGSSFGSGILSWFSGAAQTAARTVGIGTLFGAEEPNNPKANPKAA